MTQENQEVETVTKEEYDAIVAERDELLQFKPKELSDEEKAIQTKQNELWQKEVSLTLKENNLDRFVDVIKVSDEEELANTIKTLTGIVDEFKVDNAYVPTNHATANEYEKAKEKGDTTNMIKSLFGFK